MEPNGRQISNHTAANEQWAAFCDGNQDAFLHLYEQYFNLLFTWGCKWVADDPDFVKDTLHDFFIYLWEKKANLSRQVEVQTYLLTSFKRRLLTKREILKRNGLLPRELDTDIAEDPQELVDAEAFVLNFEKVKIAMASLSPAQREVIELRYLQNMSPQEIADLKKTSLRTVYNLMYRGLTTLKTEARKKNFILLW